jgi:hypothetical protein
MEVISRASERIHSLKYLFVVGKNVINKAYGLSQMGGINWHGCPQG